jgi:hypothetical protein
LRHRQNSAVHLYLRSAYGGRQNPKGVFQLPVLLPGFVARYDVLVNIIVVCRQTRCLRSDFDRALKNPQEVIQVEME